MTEIRATLDHVARVMAALRGEVVVPPVRGFSFVDPGLLPHSPGGADPARALANACRELRLDFCFVPVDTRWSSEAITGVSGAGAVPFAVIDGVSARVEKRLGFNAYAISSHRDPDSLRDELDSALADAEREAVTAIETGARALVIADDLAGASGTLLEPAFIESAIISRHARVVERARERGVPAVLHTDGDVRLLYRSMAGAGFGAVHGDCGSPENVHPSFSAARSFGLAFMGGIPSAALNDHATAALAGALAGTMAMAGGVLVCDDGGIASPGEAAALFSALAAAGA